jgi:hypothetical protein
MEVAMKLFPPNFRWLLVFFWLAILTVVATTQVEAEEYTQEIFLRLPGAYMDERGITFGPTGIGVDFDNNLCIFFNRTLTFYDSAGDTIRQLQLQPGDDFCLDEEGNIYVSQNTSGEIMIRKYNGNGDLLSEMYNYKVLRPDPPREYFYGRYINYFPEVGLYLHFKWPSILFEFEDGEFPDAFLQSDVTSEYLFGREKYLSTEDGLSATRDIWVHDDDKVVRTLHLSGHRNISAEPIYSLDSAHQYYLVYTFVDQYSNEMTDSLQKYDGDELLFSTGELPPNEIEYSRGKQFVVDSRGIIYYYCGDENEILIIRWIPANIEH